MDGAVSFIEMSFCVIVSYELRFEPSLTLANHADSTKDHDGMKCRSLTENLKNLKYSVLRRLPINHQIGTSKCSSASRVPATYFTVSTEYVTLITITFFTPRSIKYGLMLRALTQWPSMSSSFASTRIIAVVGATGTGKSEVSCG